MLGSVLRDSIVYGLASVFSRALAVLLLPLYARVLSIEEYGAYDILVTAGVLASLVVALEVVQGLARYWPEAGDRDAQIGYASSSLVFSVLMYGVFLALALLFSESLTVMLLGDAAFLVAFRLGACFIAANGLYLFLLNQFRWEFRSKTYAFISILYATMTLGLAALLCLVFDKGLEGVMLAQFLAAMLCAMASIWLLRGTFRLQLDMEKLLQMLRFSTPLVPAALAVFVTLYINRFALSYYASLEAVGLFAIAARIAGLSTLLIMGVQMALTPLVYQHYREPETPGRIARLFSWFSAVALLACLFLSLFSRELILLLASEEFLEASGVVAILAPALLLSQLYIFLPGIAIRKKTVWQLWVTLASALVSVGANMLLVPHFGIHGAGLATLCSSLVFFVLWLLASQSLYHVPYRYMPGAISVLAFILMAVLGDWLGTQSGTSWVVIFWKAALMVVFALMMVGLKLVTRTELRALYDKVASRGGEAEVSSSEGRGS